MSLTTEQFLPLDAMLERYMRSSCVCPSVDGRAMLVNSCCHEECVLKTFQTALMYCCNNEREFTANLEGFAASGPRIFRFLAAKNYSPTD